MDNKSRYDAIHAEFVDFTAQIIDELSPLDPSIGHPDAKKCLYRIYRDLRFTQDKRPYKTHISFFLSSHGIKRSGEAGYYLQIGQVDEEKSSGLFDSPQGRRICFSPLRYRNIHRMFIYIGVR